MSAETNKSTELLTPEVQKELERRGWALSEASASLARADSPGLLMQEACASIASQGPYILAWVGKAEDDEKSR